MKKEIRFLDLFAGAGGLSEGFVKAGYQPISHVEIDTAACNTLRTRMVYHWLISKNREGAYKEYIERKISRDELWRMTDERAIRSVINMDISDNTMGALFSQIDTNLNGKNLDLIIGGPPCQTYSIIGRSRNGTKMKSDSRNYLYKCYAEFIRRYKPEYFVFENVTGLLSSKDTDGNLYFDKMRELFKKVGYETEYSILSANDYGVPQHRKRLILVGKKGKQQGFFPTPDKDNLNTNIDQVFSGLSKIKSGEGSLLESKKCLIQGDYLIKNKIVSKELPVTFHSARPHTEQDLQIYEIAVQKWNKNKKRLHYNDLPEKLKSHNNRNSFTDRFKVVAGNLPASHTVVAHIAKDGHYYIHPDIKQNRSITPRESARLQTFPDDYFFESVGEKPSRTPAFRQIGNAVPVLLAYRIAKKLKEVW